MNVESPPIDAIIPFERSGLVYITLGEVVPSQDAMGRIAKWALELMDQGITYASRTAIKSQVLADFIAEWTEVQMPPAVVDQEY